MSKKEILNVLKFHDIDVKWVQDFFSLLRGNVRIGTKFCHLLRRDRKFKAALDCILDGMRRRFVWLCGDHPASPEWRKRES